MDPADTWSLKELVSEQTEKKSWEKILPGSGFCVFSTTEQRRKEIEEFNNVFLPKFTTVFVLVSNANVLTKFAVVKSLRS